MVCETRRRPTRDDRRTGAGGGDRPQVVQRMPRQGLPPRFPCIRRPHTESPTKPRSTTPRMAAIRPA